LFLVITSVETKKGDFMSKVFFAALLSLASYSYAGVECDCNLVYPVVGNYEANVTVTRVTGIFKIDADSACKNAVISKMNSMIIKPKVYSHRLVNCISTAPVVTE
jgi:hypothetical protein